MIPWPEIVAGVVMGFLGSVPVAGPVALVVATRGLNGDPGGGRALAVGAGLAEGVMAGVVYAGMGWMVSAAPAVRGAVEWVGVAVLVGVGIWFVVRGIGRPREFEGGSSDRGRFMQEAVLGAGMVFGNLGMIGTWGAAVAVLEGTGWIVASAGKAGAFGAGVAIGVVGWFWLLLAAIRRWRGAMGTPVMNTGVRIVGGTLVGIGLFEGWRLLGG